MTRICERCGGSGHELYEDLNDQGHICTSSRPFPRCARSTQWGIVAVLALLLGVLPSLIVGLMG